MLESTKLFAGNRLPEVLGGIGLDSEHPHPGIYPDSNQPQGWSDSAIVLLVQSLLGMHAFAPLRLLLVDLHLPPWLPDLELKGIRVGSASGPEGLEDRSRQDALPRDTAGRPAVGRTPAASADAGRFAADQAYSADRIASAGSREVLC